MENNKNFNNQVIIIGGDHHNTLAVIRSFGKKKIQNKILIHGTIKEKKNIMVGHSKYAKNIECIEENETKVIKWLLDNKIDNYKQVIIPCSDFAEYVIDNNYILLSKHYYIPGFKDKPGMVCKMMDKFEQKKWADKNNILMAKSWLVHKIDNYFELPEDIVFPCIVKPNISANGKKSDIRICNNVKELNDNLGIFIKTYDNIIIQEFIKKDYELLAMGLISETGYIGFGGIERKIKETIPGGGGSTALGQFIIDEDICKKCNLVLDKLYNEGYRGLYDIEFFECRGEIYLNEINFRHSGSGFSLIKNGINAPYMYYNEQMLSIASPIVKMKHPKGYFICDIGELNLLLKYKSISFLEFIKDFIKSYSHSVLEIKDISPFVYLIKKNVFKRKKG